MDGKLEEKVEELLKQGYSLDDIESMVRNLKSASVPEKDDWEIDVKQVSAPQLLLYIGGLIVLLAGIIYITINWQKWDSLLRILAIFIPNVILLAAGVKLWYTEFKIQSLVFLTVGALLFPLFLCILFQEMNWFTQVFGYEFNLAISALSLALYILMRYVFPNQVWVLLYSSAGLPGWYYLLRLIGIKDFSYDPLIVWMFLVLAVVYFILGFMYEVIDKKTEYAKFSFAFGSIVTIISLFTLSSDAQVLGFLKAGIGNDKRDLYIWSHLISGVIYFLITFLLEMTRKVKLTEAPQFSVLFNFMGTITVLSSIFALGLGGEKFPYETMLLITSLFFIFISTVKLSRAYLYFGTLFLIIYIFDIGFEYFQNDIGWPISLFISGLLSMGVGFGMEKLQKKYFST